MALMGVKSIERGFGKISNTVDNKDFHDLIEKLKDGDKSAFDAIYKKCYKYLVFVCSKFCNNKEDMEDIIQETFLIAFRKASELRADTLLAYLRKIAVHECYRKLNKNMQEYILPYDDKYVENQADLDEDFLPENYLQNKESREELLSTIKSLPEKQWKMIYLYYYAEFSTKEIAGMYSCSDRNVRKILHTAREAIKAKLGGQIYKVVALAPLAALFLAEEQAFAAGYASVVNISPPSAAKPVYTYAVASCVVVVVGVVAAALYFTSPSYDGAYSPYKPNYEANVYELKIDKEDEKPKEEYFVEDFKPPSPEAADFDSVDYQEGAGEPPLEDMSEFEVVKEELTQYEVELFEEPEPAEEPKVELEELMPDDDMPIDRTQEILLALEAARSHEDVAGTISRFNFIFERQMRTFLGELLRFYVVNEGSGDILIGTSIHEDGSGWHMRFEFFENSTMPQDIADLLLWMD